MLVVKIELWPGGDKTYRRTIAEAKIGNTASSTDELGETGNYSYFITESASKVTTSRVSAAGFLSGFPRTRLGVWDLLYRILADTVGDRNQPADE